MIIKLTEIDVNQHISRLQSITRLVNALGVRITINQVDLMLVSAGWVRELSAELLKLHPGLVKNTEKRTENQLLVQDLTEVYSGTGTRVYVTGMRSRSER